MQNVVEHVVPRLEEIAFHRSLATTIRGAHAEDIKVKGGGAHPLPTALTDVPFTLTIKRSDCGTEALSGP